MICMQRGGGGIDSFVGGVELDGTRHNKVMTFKSSHALLAGQPLIFLEIPAC